MPCKWEPLACLVVDLGWRERLLREGGLTYIAHCEVGPARCLSSPSTKPFRRHAAEACEAYRMLHGGLQHSVVKPCKFRARTLHPYGIAHLFGGEGLVNASSTCATKTMRQASTERPAGSQRSYLLHVISSAPFVLRLEPAVLQGRHDHQRWERHKACAKYSLYIPQYSGM